jgi:hypothetical protein
MEKIRDYIITNNKFTFDTNDHNELTALNYIVNILKLMGRKNFTFQYQSFHYEYIK